MSRLKFHLDTLNQLCFMHNSSEACMLLQRSGSAGLLSYSVLPGSSWWVFLGWITVWPTQSICYFPQPLEQTASNMYPVNLGLCWGHARRRSPQQPQESAAWNLRMSLSLRGEHQPVREWSSEKNRDILGPNLIPVQWLLGSFPGCD